MEQESVENLVFPEGGVDLTRGFGNQAPNTTREGVNVRTFEPRSGRARGGSRSGLSRFIVPPFDGPIQGLFLGITTSPGGAADPGDLLLNDAGSGGGGGGGSGGSSPSFDPFFGPMGSAPRRTPDPRELALQAAFDGRLYAAPGSGYQPGSRVAATITWASLTLAPTATLRSSHLNATATHPTTGAAISGTFTYYPSLGSQYTANGTYTLYAVFTPADTTTYSPVIGTTTLTVSAAGQGSPSGGGTCGDPYIAAQEQNNTPYLEQIGGSSAAIYKFTPASTGTYYFRLAFLQDADSPEADAGTADTFIAQASGCPGVDEWPVLSLTISRPSPVACDSTTLTGGTAYYFSVQNTDVNEPGWCSFTIGTGTCP